MARSAARTPQKFGAPLSGGTGAPPRRSLEESPFCFQDASSLSFSHSLSSGSGGRPRFGAPPPLQPAA
eukprot:5252421-Alexandrium_andersonii.AAC.1